MIATQFAGSGLSPSPDVMVTGFATGESVETGFDGSDPVTSRRGTSCA